MGYTMKRRRRCVLIGRLTVMVAMAVLSDRPVLGQYALGDGRELDRNLQVGSGGRLSAQLVENSSPRLTGPKIRGRISPGVYEGESSQAIGNHSSPQRRSEHPLGPGAS